MAHRNTTNECMHHPQSQGLLECAHKRNYRRRDNEEQAEDTTMELMASKNSLYKLFVTLMLFDYICLGSATHAVGK